MSIRLLKVIAQPVFVNDNGEDLDELVVQPITLSAKAWHGLDPKVWEQELITAAESQLNEQVVGD